MMDNGLTIKQLKCDVMDEIYYHDDVKLFIKWDGQRFDFKCIEFCCGYPDGEDADYLVLFEGIAHWDGIRHLYFGNKETDNYGYLYYQNLDRLIEPLKLLKAEESKLDYVKQELKEQADED